MEQKRSGVFTLEMKSLAEDGRFAGYASVFDVTDSQRDVVRRGAFAASLKARTHPVQLLWQHQWESPIGVIDQLFEDGRGLYVEGRLLLEVSRAKEAHALLKAGAIRGMSIGYNVIRARRTDEGLRELLEVVLWEISLVTLPANEAAQVTVVKAQENYAALMRALARSERVLAD
jgi:HK97 family phage prohead protease